MRIIGIITTATLSALALGAAVIGVRSLPDVQRYLKMRAM